MATTTKKRKPGRPRLSEKGKGESPFIGIRCGGDLLARIDKYRKAQSGDPKRSEAMRGLIEKGLAAAGF